MPRRWSRLEPKVSAVVRVATASAAAITVVRTGTAVRPRPPSSAWRVPSDHGERAQGAAEEAGHERWTGRRARGGVAATTVGSSATWSAAPVSSTPRNTASMPMPITATFTSTPGDGSATRARPIGHSGESAIATTSATTVASSAIDGRAHDAGREALESGHAQRAQHGMVGRLEERLPRQGLGRHQECGERDQPGEQPQHDGREVQRAVDVGLVVGLRETEEHRRTAAEARDVGTEASRGR